MGGIFAAELGKGLVKYRPGKNSDLNKLNGKEGQPVFFKPGETPNDVDFILGGDSWGLRFFGVLSRDTDYGQECGRVFTRGTVNARVKAATNAYPGAYVAPNGGANGHFYVSAFPTPFRLVTDLTGQTAGTVYGPDKPCDQGDLTGTVPRIAITGPCTSIFWESPNAASPTAVHAGLSGNTAQDVTTGITNPDTPRNIQADTTGTAGSVGAISVTVYGTNVAGKAISEVLPAFTAGSHTTVAGNLAFATVTRIVIPQHAGSGVTTRVGVGDKLGLPDAAAVRIVEFAAFDGTIEGTLPTLVKDADEVEKNTCDPNSVLNNKQFVLGLYER